MLVLGIDPGLERVGYGIVRRAGSKLTAEAYGLIETPRIALSDRLSLIHDQVTGLIVKHNPNAFATEKLLFSVNAKTAMDVAKAIGVILLCASQQGLSPTEYTPPEIKLSVVGNGAADKKQIQFMVMRLLSLTEAPKPDDVADALAIATCHALRNPTIPRR